MDRLRDHKRDGFSKKLVSIDTKVKSNSHWVVELSADVVASVASLDAAFSDCVETHRR